MKDSPILVINSGSSSLKVSLFTPTLERIWDEHVKNIQDLKQSLREIIEKYSPVTPQAIGHRFVHGGENYTQPTQLNDKAIEDLKSLSKLAPLHNPACLEGIAAAQELFPNTPQYAVFDTAFHATIPDYAHTYGLPYDLAQKHAIKRYGFHGIAHEAMWKAYAAKQKKTERVITLQLGNGCSICAIKNGKSIDISMGFTPTEGLLMSSRSGDLDPGIQEYLCREEGLSITQVMEMLNKRSGLLGISGLSTDMKTLLGNRDNLQVNLAIQVFCYRIIKYIGAYTSVLGGCDALLFGGGIGENSDVIRAEILQSFAKLDLEINQRARGVGVGELRIISEKDSPLQAYVVGVDENRAIAEQAIKP